MTLTPVTERDLEIMRLQLGRPMRDAVGIAARCVCGAPTVVSTMPRLSDDSPFPTFYYLTHPAATAAISTLEATGFMAAQQGRLADDESVRDAYLAAHLAYIADRDSFGTVDEIDGISAGGMPVRVKCLHALVGHSLAAGEGINPIGDAALDACKWSPTRCECLPDQRG